MVCCCIGGPYDDRCAIVAVDLRTGIAKRVVHYPSYLLLTGMMIKGDYLYFLAKGHDYDGNAYHLYRVNLLTGKKKCLVREISGYVIQGNKIYFRKTLKKNTFPYGIRGYKNMVMKSSGQAKKSTSVKALNKHKNTNASDYRILKEEAGKYIRFYLLKPTNEKIYMGQFEDEDYYYYVKAVPKVMVPVPSMTVRNFSSPGYGDADYDEFAEETPSDSSADGRH